MLSTVEFGLQTPNIEYSVGSIKKELNVSEAPEALDYWLLSGELNSS